MLHSDSGREALHSIMQSYQEFCKLHGKVSEADTRANLIDRVLTEVCGWPDLHITRENQVESGRMDFRLLVHSLPVVVVEAKRSGIAFELPSDKTQRHYKLNGTLVTDKPIKEAIDQVRQYCDDGSIRFAIATNGYAWIVFRALRDDGIPWKEGQARVFPSLEYIYENFTEFWNLLGYYNITRGSLHDEFSGTLRTSREIHRVIDRLFNADVPLQRNRLNSALQPLIKLIFEDIADQAQIDVLKSCYIHTHSLLTVSRDLDAVITERIPTFLEQDGTVPAGLPTTSGGFEQSFRKAVEQNRGELFLLLGGIGSGKTTFLKRFQRTTGATLLQDSTIWFSVDFLKAPNEPSELEPFVWSGILAEIRDRYRDRNFEQRRHVKEVFANDIAAVESTFLNDYKRGSHKYEEALSPFLQKWQQDLSKYVPGLIIAGSKRESRVPLLFIDNVDQLSPAYQAQIFLLAQRVTRLAGCQTVVALREESYYTPSVQKSFTAYTNRKFHIAPPHFKRMILSRLSYAIKVLKARRSETHDTNEKQRDDDMGDFFGIVQSSIFGGNQNIARFIRALCQGDMRLALRMFATFLCSGVTDVDKMLRIQRREGSYNVAFHEFVKAIMLGERRYYKEEQSPVFNMFNTGTEKNSSHFTAWRILNVLLSHEGESTVEGRGFVDIARLENEFEERFDNRQDFVSTIVRLVAGRLVEANNRATDSIDGASHVRITSAGWYYLKYLCEAFAYLDLVLQDTPFSNLNVEAEIRQAVHDVDNLSDKEDEKLVRMKVRFDRVDTFLDYLADEETLERGKFELDKVEGAIGAPIMPAVREKFRREREWIERRLRENREKYEEELGVDWHEEEFEALQEVREEDEASDAEEE